MRRWPPRFVFGLYAVALLGSTPVRPASALGQDPPPPDSLAPPDSVVSDSALAVLDSAEAPPDTATAVDSLIAFDLPEFTGGARADQTGWSFEWDHDEIMASAAVSLGELLSEVPGILVLLGGDYGAPVGASTYGVGGGGMRIFRDGFELYPFAGGVPDLSRIGLGGIERIRVTRNLGGMTVELFSLTHNDGRTFSLIEVGTGESDTNLFRGALAAPRSLGGSLGISLERVDTKGSGGNEPGNFAGTWFRYQWHRGDRLGVALDYRSMRSETDLEPSPSALSRTDWVVRARGRSGGLTGEMFFGTSSHGLPEASDTSGVGPGVRYEGGNRRQFGGRAEYAGSGAWALGEARYFPGSRLPALRIDGSVGYSRDSWGGVEGRYERSTWEDDGLQARSVRAWTAPLAGVISLFASIEDGDYGTRRSVVSELVSPGDPLAEEDSLPADESLFGVAARSGRRIGAALQWRGALASGAAISASADTIFPLALAPETGAVAVPGLAERQGLEFRGRIPVPWIDGLSMEGHYMSWDAHAPYLPRTSYGGALVFHRTYLESGNFEWWWRAGLRGHSELTLPTLASADANGARAFVSTPVFRYWYARTQARILTVRIFVRWDNLTGNPELQYFPDRVLPAWRTIFGIRWTMFN